MTDFEVLPNGQPAYQGDIQIVSVEDLPEGLVPVERTDGVLVVAHSETGYHHTISDDGVALFDNPADPLTRYVVVPPRRSARLEHKRSYDTHRTLRMAGRPNVMTVYKITRQREWAPEGWRQVVD